MSAAKPAASAVIARRSTRGDASRPMGTGPGWSSRHRARRCRSGIEGARRIVPGSSRGGEALRGTFGVWSRRTPRSSPSSTGARFESVRVSEWVTRSRERGTRAKTDIAFAPNSRSVEAARAVNRRRSAGPNSIGAPPMSPSTQAAPHDGDASSRAADGVPRTTNVRSRRRSASSSRNPICSLPSQSARGSRGASPSPASDGFAGAPPFDGTAVTDDASTASEAALRSAARSTSSGAVAETVSAATASSETDHARRGRHAEARPAPFATTRRRC